MHLFCERDPDADVAYLKKNEPMFLQMDSPADIYGSITFPLFWVIS